MSDRQMYDIRAFLWTIIAMLAKLSFPQSKVYWLLFSFAVINGIGSLLASDEVKR